MPKKSKTDAVCGDNLIHVACLDSDYMMEARLRLLMVRMLWHLGSGGGYLIARCNLTPKKLCYKSASKTSNSRQKQR